MINQQKDEPAVTWEMHMFFLASLRLQLNITSENSFFIFINFLNTIVSSYNV